MVAYTIGGFPIFAGALALVLGAQLSALVTILLGWVLAIFSACALAGVAVALAEGAPMAWPIAQQLVEGLAAGWLVLLAWGLAGALLATLFRGVALPIGLGVVWILGIETLLAAAVITTLLPDLEPVADTLPGVKRRSPRARRHPLRPR